MTDILPNEVRAIADGVSVWDVSEYLPQHEIKEYVFRDLEKVVRTYLHHSGRLGRPGFAGAFNSARYCVETRGWPGAPYHFWICHEPLEHKDELLVLKMQPLDVRCYHTGGECNTHGVGVALQGNTSVDGMSDFQIECLEALVPYLAEKLGYGYEDIAGHYEARKWGAPRNKSSCPGKAARTWLEEYRGLAVESPDAPDTKV